MALVPLLPIFHSLNRRFFECDLALHHEAIVAVRWSNGRLTKTAGFYRRGPSIKGPQKAEIVLSKPVLEYLPLKATQSTLCHEMIHAWIDLVLKKKENHGPIFIRCMNAINASQSEFKVSVRHQFPVPLKSYKWIATCSLCGLQAPYKKRVSGLACKNCCNTHYGGRWHESCLLHFQSALIGA